MLEKNHRSKYQKWKEMASKNLHLTGEPGIEKEKLKPVNQMSQRTGGQKMYFLLVETLTPRGSE